MKFGKRIRFFIVLAIVCLVSRMALRTSMAEEIPEAGAGERQTQTHTFLEEDTDEYTDTDTRRGILAIRMNAFDEFRGEVEFFCCRSGTREWSLTLTPEKQYVENCSLPVGDYQITGILAASGGREYDCMADNEFFSIREGEVTLIRMTVSAGSLYRVPYEVEENAGEKLEERVQGESLTEERVMEEDIVEEEKNERADNRKAKGIPVLVLTGILGIAVCGWLFYLAVKQTKEGGS